MRKGTVLYLTDAAAIAGDFDEGQALAALGLTESWTVVTSEALDESELHHATKVLIERGASHVEALKGRVGVDGQIELFGEPLRLFG